MTTEYADKTLTCSNCGKPFIWTAGSQGWYAEKGVPAQRTLCTSCHPAARKRYQRLVMRELVNELTRIVILGGSYRRAKC
jgi:hypothetical protein